MIPSSIKSQSLFHLKTMLNEGKINTIILVSVDFKVLGAVHNSGDLLPAIRKLKPAGLYAEDVNDAFVCTLDLGAAQSVPKGSIPLMETVLHSNLHKHADSGFSNTLLERTLADNNMRINSLAFYMVEHVRERHITSQLIGLNYELDERVYKALSIKIGSLQVVITTSSILIPTGLGLNNELVIHSPDRDLEIDELREIFRGLGLGKHVSNIVRILTN